MYINTDENKSDNLIKKIVNIVPLEIYRKVEQIMLERTNAKLTFETIRRLTINTVGKIEKMELVF